ncbi:hypothetical protein AVEN_152561-1 [Araneus ventricosus]|uniref:Uncharacterized protein n=1 Tax=Araneus ventricosus TaxID=182803 RepID=A0A4Y2M698_ARAVE|nr:hypothetical protein AVEN_152561-1 [Araneus ventricosus]
MYFSNFFALMILFGALLSEGKVLSSNMYHRIDVRSHGCRRAPPLYEILVGATADGKMTFEQVLEVLEQDKSINEKVIEIMKEYDECLRTGDGMRDRKSQRSELSEAYAALYKKMSEALQ